MAELSRLGKAANSRIISRSSCLTVRSDHQRPQPVFPSSHCSSAWVPAGPFTMPPRAFATVLRPTPVPRIPLLLPSIPSRSIYSIDRSISRRPKRTKMNDPKTNPLLSVSHAAALKRRELTTPLRTGVMAVKKGMSAIYDPKTGVRQAVTIVQLDRNQVVAHKTVEKNGYWAVQMGMGARNSKNVTRPMMGHFATAGVSPKRELHEFKVRDEKGLLEVGTPVGAGWFREGDYIDVKANCRGMGFEGPMKRHNMKGQPASHGVSLAHRSLGSAGQSQGGGSRVYPGKRMAGNMGGQQVTVNNIRILKVDEVNQLLILKGCVPGPKKAIVKLQDAYRKRWPDLPGLLADTSEAAEPTTNPA